MTKTELAQILREEASLQMNRSPAAQRAIRGVAESIGIVLPQAEQKRFLAIFKEAPGPAI